MKNHPKSFPLIILLVLQIPICFCQDDLYQTCRDQQFRCGGTTVGYPFWGGDRPDSCGRPGFELNCNDGSIIEVKVESVTYRILRVDAPARTVRLARDDLWSDLCPQYLFNTSFVTPHFFNLFSFQRIDLYYGCNFPSPTTPYPNQFDCDVNGTTTFSFYQYVATGIPNLQYDAICKQRIATYVDQTASLSATMGRAGLLAALKYGFLVQWEADDNSCTNCVQSGGACGYDTNSNQFACYCMNGTFDDTCGGGTPRGKTSKTNVGLVAGLSIAGAVVAGFGLVFLFVCCRRRRKQRRSLPLAVQAPTAVSKEISNPPSLSTPVSTPSSKFSSSIPSYPSSNSELGRGSSYFGAHVFSYTELEQATDNFNPSKELGEGGFGTVYYGELPDGRCIAVKRLFENNFRRVEQFMNEVEILMQLRHPNLVTLHGCTSRTSRELLLVYEYIPNGTVADHVHGKRSNSGLLSWPVRLNIAIETAEALAFLHKSGIIHRDVKTNNILLDKDFHVKVADFGLSRLFPTDVTHVSTAPQGTPGYVDPEYHQCYQLTEKSDVYSFGVVLIELISSLMAVDTSRHRHDINLSNMAVTKIQNHLLHELVDPTLGFDTNGMVRRRITLVAELAFRCLQHERDMRPLMAEVLECMKRIRDDTTSANMVEVVDILVDEDETGPLKDGMVPPPPPPEA